MSSSVSGTSTANPSIEPLERRIHLSVAGHLDPTFGGSGQVAVDFGAQAYGANVAIQPDGKIVAVGGTADGTGPGHDDWAITRLNPDGFVDRSFANNGMRIISFGSYDESFSVLIQPDGKILIGGDATPGSNTDFGIVRLNSDGQFDPTFGANGIVLTDFLGFGDGMTNLRLTSDGKILAGGRAGTSTGDAFAAARYLPDGSLDPTFGQGGKFIASFTSSSDDRAEAMALQPDGKILLAGPCRSSGTQHDWGVQRLTPDGILDTTFGAGGKITYDGFGEADEVRGVLVASDDKILVGGWLNHNAVGVPAIVRFNANGTLDTTFGAGGRATLDTRPGEDDQVRDMAFQADGKIIAIGRALGLAGTASDGSIWRLLPDGTLDTTFNGTGQTQLDYAHDFDTFEGTALQPDGKIVVAQESKVSGRLTFVVERFQVADRDTVLVTGADAGAAPRVQVFARLGSGEARVLTYDFLAFDSAFGGGVRVASGDVTGDGVADFIVAAGPGAGPHIKVFDGASGALIRSFFAYDAGFQGGVFVAAGDVTGDGIDDIITGAGSGAGPHVKVFNGATGALVRSFFAYDPTFLGGVHVAAGDTNADGRTDIITGAATTAPHVRVFSGQSDNRALLSFMAYANYGDGVFVAAPNAGSGRADIVTTPVSAAGDVRVFNGSTGALTGNFIISDSRFAGGARVAWARLSGMGEILVAPSPGFAPVVQGFDAATLAKIEQIAITDGAPALLLAAG